MGRAAFGQHVAGKMVAPHQQRHFQFDAWQRPLAMDHDVVRSAILEAMRANEPKAVSNVTEPETTGVEKVRTQIRQHAGALVPPWRIAHEPRRAVAVEHAAGIDCAEL